MPCPECGSPTAGVAEWILRKLRRLRGKHAAGPTCTACLAKIRRGSDAGTPVPRLPAGGYTAGSPAPLVKVACRFGASCYQVSPEHCERFTHPGDQCYRLGQVAFDSGPELDTLWDVFTYFDSRSSGYLRLRDFRAAAAELAQRGLLRDSPRRFEDVAAEWAAAGGVQRGHVSFVRFATWASRQGVNLAVGLEVKPGSARRCHASVLGVGCTCHTFIEGDGIACACCGHADRVHWSDSSRQGLAALLLSCRPLHWASGVTGLVKLTDSVILEKLSSLLICTHKEADNWTRDRGCVLHGVNACEPACIFKNKVAVPSGYRLTSAQRNQSPLHWARYSMIRAAILKELRARGGCKRVSTESSQEPFDRLDGAPLDERMNEWWLFHGSSEASCLAICERNFTLDLAGSGATWTRSGAGTSLYGPGVYFAERITKADEYAVGSAGEGDTTVYTVLLCRVVAGSPRVCTTNQIDTDRLREDILGGLHHSVLGDRVSELKKPFREIVVYDTDQVYPEFLLTYTRHY
ncbi:Tnks [Symbiodinium natans]|uniref:Tnks protein n=1 Tax=Symbiodinium natans TaxID=878477 RepID=A0A812MYU1_9DINO|nr:Tnks [Symbiodinium natans]